jgi:hypothetical protein
MAASADCIEYSVEEAGAAVAAKMDDGYAVAGITTMKTGKIAVLFVKSS